MKKGVYIMRNLKKCICLLLITVLFTGAFTVRAEEDMPYKIIGVYDSAVMKAFSSLSYTSTDVMNNEDIRYIVSVVAGMDFYIMPLSEEYESLIMNKTSYMASSGKCAMMYAFPVMHEGKEKYVGVCFSTADVSGGHFILFESYEALRLYMDRFCDKVMENKPDKMYTASAQVYEALVS